MTATIEKSTSDGVVQYVHGLGRAARAAACRSSGANREKAAVMGTKLRAMKMLERQLRK